MYNDNWEARVIFQPGNMLNAVYLSRKRGYDVREYLTPGDIIKSVKLDQPTKEELHFAMLDEDQMRALMTAFDNHGVKRPDAGFTEGKLEATEKHLEDTRTLLSLNVPRLMNPIPMQEAKGKK